MKYCKVCKLRAKDTEIVCGRCGGELSALGATTGTSGKSTQGPALGLQGQIQELQAVHSRNIHRSKILAGVSAVVVIVMLVVAYQVFSHRVLAYAELSNIKVEQDDSFDSLIRVSFDVVSPGKVALDRRSGGRHSEKIDVFTNTGPQELSWVWPSSESGIKFSVHHRDGWSTAFVESSDMTSKLDVVFLIDTTRSMQPYIKALKRECNDFAATVRREGYDCGLGLVGFGDINDGGEIVVFEPTDEVQLFQTRIDRLKVTRGGDLPESGVAALKKALNLQFRKGTTVCFVHITDASTHEFDQIPRIAAQLKQRKIVTYVVSDQEHANLYDPLCVNGGEFFDIEQAEFEEILQLVAKSIVSEIKYK